MADDPKDDITPLTTAELLRRIAALASPEDRAKVQRDLLRQYQPVATFDRTPQAEKLESLGWKPWLITMAPHVFSHGFEDFDTHYWDWYWQLLIAKRDGQLLVNLDVELAYLDTLARGLGKCLAKGTLVHKADGTQQPIEDIEVGQRVLSYDQATGRSVVDVVTNKWNSGRKPCFKIRTKTNKTLMLTAEHRLWSFDGWKELKDLKVGDRIALPRRIRPDEKLHSAMRGSQLSFTEQDSLVSDEEVRLLAYMLAEGSTGGGYEGASPTSCHSQFTNADPVLVDDFYICAASMGFGVNRINGESKYGHTMRGAQQWLRDVEMSKKRSWEKTLPAWVFTLPERQRWMFLAVFMDTDGYFDRDASGYSGITLASPQMIEDLANLFLSVGVVCRTHKKTDYRHGAWVLAIDHEGMNLCAEHMPLLLKGDRLARLHSIPHYSLYDVYPFEIGRNLPPGKIYELQKKGLRLGRSKHPTLTRSKVRRAINLYPNPRWLWLEQAEVFWDRVESIDSAGECETYDIETRSHHNFIANGIVSHNSSKAEWSVIMLGAILRGEVLALYVSSTSGLAESHLNNIREELESPIVEEYYPRLANPQVGKFNNRYGWNQNLLATHSGLTVFAAGLQEEVRGLKRKNLRPALIVADEFDSKHDTLDMVLKKESIIGGSLFGTQTADTIIVMAQNLIHANSVASRTFKRRNELLSRRRESGLIKAFTDDLEITMVGTRYKATKGKARYLRLNLANFQKYLDTSGPVETYAEYQHLFDRNREGRVLTNYNDQIMVITKTDFRNIYGCDRPPAAWNKYVFNDKARTKTEWHANVGGTLSMSGMNTKLPGITFLYDCISFEENTQPDDCAVAFLKCISPTVVVDGIEYEWEALVRELIARSEIAKFTRNLTERIKVQREGLAKIIPKYVHPLLTSQHYIRFRMSHEADDWLRVYRESFGLPFEPAVPTHDAGIDLINFSMKIDFDVVDPFGRRVVDDWGQPKPLMGMSRFYIIVDDSKIAYPNDNKPDQLHGSDLARYQFTEHRWLTPKLNAIGEKERGQEKKNDDFVNGLQFFYMDYSIRARELTPQEMAEAEMPSHLQLTSIHAQEDPETREHMMMAREVALKKEYFAKISRQLGPGQRRRPGNRMADFRHMDKVRH